jgi:hypothetical protein
MSPVRIKISHPKIWLQFGHWDYLNHTQDGKGKWNNYRFFVNDESCTECDFWIIHEKTDAVEKTKCPPENVIFVPGEEIFAPKSQYKQTYLDQFAAVFTSRSDIKKPNVSRGLYLSTWQVQKTYTEFSKMTFPDKEKTLSAIISNSTYLEGHRNRYALINKLKGHFKDKLDWFAKGENFIENKWDGLVDYQYTIAIENCRLPYYITEKVMDCYLAFAMPFYLGGTNMKDFYPEQSFIDLENYDYLSCIDIIENAIRNNAAEKNKEAIMEARNLVLNHYQFIPLLIHYIEKNHSLWGSIPKINKIQPLEHFNKISLFNKVKSFAINQLKNS